MFSVQLSVWFIISSRLSSEAKQYTVYSITLRTYIFYIMFYMGWTWKRMYIVHIHTYFDKNAGIQFDSHILFGRQELVALNSLSDLLCMQYAAAAFLHALHLFNFTCYFSLILFFFAFFFCLFGSVFFQSPFNSVVCFLRSLRLLFIFILHSVDVFLTINSIFHLIFDLIVLWALQYWFNMIFTFIFDNNSIWAPLHSAPLRICIVEFSKWMNEAIHAFDLRIENSLKFN